METVEVVIRIPKREIEEIKRYCRRVELKISSLEDYIYRSIANGIVLPKENGFIAICKPNKPLPEDIKKSLKETLFIADEDCLYNFDMIEIIDTGQEAEHGDE